MVKAVRRYIVGGWVRDHLLGRPARDRDWVVVGETARSMQEKGFRQVGAAYPVFLDPDDGEEHTLARDGAGRPALAATIEADLGFRDFTINALAMDEAGAVTDPLGGLADLKGGILRHVDGAFERDPIRLLRGARFAARFTDFTLAPGTLAEMARIVAEGGLAGATPERVWLETEKALAEARPSRYFRILQETGALAVLMPELDALHGVPQRALYHPEIDSFVHTMMTLDVATTLTGDPAIRFAALVHDLGKGTTPPEILPRHTGHDMRGEALVGPMVRRLAGPALYADLGAMAARWHMHVANAPTLKPSTMVRLFDAVNAFHLPERLEALILVAEADNRGRGGHQDDPFPEGGVMREAFAAAAAITARDLIGAGQTASPALGQLLFQRRAQAVRAALGRAGEAD